MYVKNEAAGWTDPTAPNRPVVESHAGQGL